LVIQRKNKAGQQEFLLRSSESWGWALPMKLHRSMSDKPSDLAEKIATDELSLDPVSQLKITAARVPSLCMYRTSRRVKERSFYRHWLFDGKLARGAKPTSRDPARKLIWATEDEIREGQISRPGAGKNNVSVTVRPVLRELNYV
jgi:hypothetical protein